MSVLNQSGEEQVECPLCMEPLEVDDLNFFPCTCGYQICRFCWHRIRTDENGLCPACRKAYPENPADFKPLTQEEVAKLKAEKRLKDHQRKQRITENRKHLANVRVVQKNLVFVVGLPMRLADAEVLKKHEYFGKFGKIHKVVINQSTSYAGSQGPSASAYVTYVKAEDALRAIQAVNNISVDGRTIKTSLGTTKYCSHFMKNQPCPKPDCMYLHDLGDAEASFTKDEMQQGKHQEYEKKLHDQLLYNSYNHNAGKDRKQTPSPPTVGNISNLCTNSGQLTTTYSNSNSNTSTSSSNVYIQSGQTCNKEAWPSLQLGLTTAGNNNGTNTIVMTTVANSGNNKSEGNQRRQKSEQSKSNSTNHKKRHAATDENRGKSKEKSHYSNEEHQLNNRISQTKLKKESNQPLRPVNHECDSLENDKNEVPGRGRGLVLTTNHRAAALFEQDNNSFFSSNTFTKLKAATSASSDWPPNGLTLTHMPDSLPPVESSEDWQAAFGFSNNHNSSPSNGSSASSSVPANGIESSLSDISPTNGSSSPNCGVSKTADCESEDSGYGQGSVINSGYQVTLTRSGSMDRVTSPPKYASAHNYELIRGMLKNQKVVSVVNNVNGSGFVDDMIQSQNSVNGLRQVYQNVQLTHCAREPSDMDTAYIARNSEYMPPGLVPNMMCQSINPPHIMVPNGFPPSQATNKFLADLHLRQQQEIEHHHQAYMFGRSDGVSFGCNGVGLSNPVSDIMPANKYSGFDVRDYRGRNGIIVNQNSGDLDDGSVNHLFNHSNREEYADIEGLEHDIEDKRQNSDGCMRGPTDDDLGFDPFHETQKALQELIETENRMISHDGVRLQQGLQFKHQPQFTGKMFPGHNQHLLALQNHRLPSSVSGCTKLMDGLGISGTHTQSPVPRTRLPPPGFTTAPNHMNAFGLGIPRVPTNSGSKILPFMGLGSASTTTGPSPQSPVHSQFASNSYSVHNGLTKSESATVLGPKDWPENLRTLLPNMGTAYSAQPINSTKGWNGVGPVTDWTALDPAIVSSRPPSFMGPPPSSSTYHILQQQQPCVRTSDEGCVIYGSSDWATPPPGFSSHRIQQTPTQSSLDMAKIENM